MDADIRMVVCGDAHYVSVFLFEGRAGDNDAFWELRGVCGWSGEALDSFFAEENKPVPSVCVGEGYVAGHFVFVGLGVVLLEKKLC